MSLKAALLFSILLALAGCSNGGAPASPTSEPTPTLNPLAWQDLAGGAVPVAVFDEAPVTLRLTAAVEAAYTATASNSTRPSCASYWAQVIGVA